MKKKFKIGDIVMIIGLSKFGPCEIVDCGQDEDDVWYYSVYPTEFNPPCAREFPQTQLRMYAMKEA